MFPASEHPDLVAGLGDPDDSAVYRLSDDLALIVTLDFFAPVVDDPWTYGAIAAANAMSDVYAMGGEVLLALNIAAFPRSFTDEVIIEILRGGAEKVREAGGVLAGGHTIDDEEPKFGLAVVGRVRPELVARKGGARPGDLLVLTKPLGTGVITTAFKRGAASPEHIAEASASMMRLNRAAARAMVAGRFHGATDITGFGLLGHALEMAEQAHVSFRLESAAIPLLPGTELHAAQGIFPGGTGRNRRCYAPRVRFAESVPEELRKILFTPETSGGLLVALPPEALEGFQQRCSEANQPCWRIGEVGEAAEGWLLEVV
jgi:selenide,water dikinase